MPDSCVVAILPARWGSTRFPGKPLCPIAGRPLIRHVWERARQAQRIDRVIIATDDERIAKAAQEFGAEVAMTDSTHQSGTDRIAEVAASLPQATHLLNVQGDEPLVEPALLDRLAEALIASPELGMITAANPFYDHETLVNPNVVKVVLDAGGHALYFSRSAIPHQRGGEVIGTPLLRHHGLYGYSAPFLRQFVGWQPSPLELAEQLEQLRALENGARIRVIVTECRSIGVDTPEDVARVEALLENQDAG
ncbi:MAG TPA: 3-deoxy-manno-octulosonate cytidylyltransferase [Chthoniobacteraceae bacterium]|nr:3-deoxy-manno-octulosonate cytidylyltransferase [Chthoniobacteraceae bacterium]